MGAGEHWEPGGEDVTEVPCWTAQASLDKQAILPPYCALGLHPGSQVGPAGEPDQKPGSTSVKLWGGVL